MKERDAKVKDTLRRLESERSAFERSNKTDLEKEESRLNEVTRARFRKYDNYRYWDEFPVMSFSVLTENKRASRETSLKG